MTISNQKLLLMCYDFFSRSIKDLVKGHKAQFILSSTKMMVKIMFWKRYWLSDYYKKIRQHFFEFFSKTLDFLSNQKRIKINFQGWWIMMLFIHVNILLCLHIHSLLTQKCLIIYFMLPFANVNKSELERLSIRLQNGNKRLILCLILYCILHKSHTPKENNQIKYFK